MARLHLKGLNQLGFDHMVVAVAFIALFGIAGIGALIYTHAANLPYYNFKLALDPSYCLDNYGDSSSSSGVYMYPCNSGGKVDPGEEWETYGTSDRFLLESPMNTCVSGVNGVGIPGHRKYLVTQACDSGNEKQLWHIVDGSELVNNSNGGCINDPANATSTTQLILFTCGKSPSPNYEWGQTLPPTTTSNTGGTGTGGTGSGTGGSGGTGSSGNPSPVCGHGYVCVGNSILPDLNLADYNSSTTFDSPFCGILRSYFEAGPVALSILHLNIYSAQEDYGKCFDDNGKVL